MQLLAAVGAVVAQFKGSALGAAAGGYIGTLMANLDAVQRTILLVSTMVCAAGYAAFDAGVCIFLIHFSSSFMGLRIVWEEVSWFIRKRDD